MNEFFDKDTAKRIEDLTKGDILMGNIEGRIGINGEFSHLGYAVDREPLLTDKEIRKLKTWAVKLDEKMIDEIERLYESSGLRFKNEFVEHLIQSHKVNLMKEGKLNEDLIHPSVAKQMSGDLFELAKLTQMINELFVMQLEKFSQEQYEFERIKRENENLKEQLKQKQTIKGNVVSDYIHHTIDKTTGNMLMLGTSGSGKTHASKLEIKKALNDGKQVIVFDFTGEYSALARKWGGQLITLDEHDSLNPFEFNLKEKKKTSSNPLTTKILFVYTFVETLLHRELTARERKTLLSAIEDTYRKFGITRDIESTEKIEKMPTMSNLEKALRQYEEGTVIADELDPYINGALNLFNCQRNITLYKTNFIVFNLKYIDKSLSNPASLMLMEFVFSLVKNRQLSNSLIVMDEIYSILASKQSNDFLFNFYQDSFKYGSRMILTAQNVSDFLHLNGESYIRHSHTVSYFRLHVNDISRVKHLKLISSDLVEFLRTAKKGESIVHIESSYYPIQLIFQYPDDEEITSQPFDDILI